MFLDLVRKIVVIQVNTDCGVNCVKVCELLRSDENVVIGHKSCNCFLTTRIFSGPRELE